MADKNLNKPKKRPYKRKQQVPLCKIPFIVVNFTPPATRTPKFDEKGNPKLPYTMHNKKHLRLKSSEPLKCYGDSTVLGKLKLPKCAPNESLTDVLGPIGKQIPSTFKRVNQLTEHFAEKYNE